MRRGLLSLLLIVMSAFIIDTCVIAEDQGSEWMILQSVDEFGDVTENSTTAVFTTISGDFSNTATIKSDLNGIVYMIIPNAVPVFVFRLFEYGRTKATFLSSDSISLKVKIDDVITEYTEVTGTPPNSDLMTFDVDKIIFDALSSGKDVRCIIYIGSSKYNFTINSSNFSAIATPLLEEAVTAAESAAIEKDYETALSYVQVGVMDGAIELLESLGDYKDSVDILAECKEYQQALIEGYGYDYDYLYDADMVASFVEGSKYIKPNNEIQDQFDAVIPFCGEWDFIGGDNNTLSYTSMNPEKYKAYDHLSIYVRYPLTKSYFLVFSEDGSVIWPSQTTYHADTKSFGWNNMKSGDIEFSITEQGTLRVTFKGKESSITEAVAEYKKFNNTAEEDMTESVAEEPTENRTFDDITTVQKVQIALNNAGYDCGTPDGVKGPNTTSKIQQYQSDNGLEATGEIDDILLNSLGLQ